MSALLAHGGIGGVIIEIALTLTILLIFLAVWRRERRSTTEETT